jgi:GGDEF domain-containing protein
VRPLATSCRPRLKRAMIAVDTQIMTSPPRRPAQGSPLVTRLAVGGMSIAVLTLGMLAFWATSVTDQHTRDLARAGHQISGHMRAAQALGQIDTHTDLLEDGIDPQIMLKLRGAQRVLDDSLRRMQQLHVDPRERALARDAEPHVRRLHRAIESYLAAIPSRPNEPSVGGSRDEIRNVTDPEERMETALDELQLRFNDVTWDPVQLLTRGTAGAEEDERAVQRTGLFLIPLGLLFVALCGWQLRTYRKRSEEVMLAALQDSEVDARTDHLTGLGNRRALMEELERRISEGQECTLALADLNGFKHYNDSFGHAAGDALLARLASNLKRACGDRGLPVRLGGDEFCVLFDVAESQGADARARAGRARRGRRGIPSHQCVRPRTDPG